MHQAVKDGIGRRGTRKPLVPAVHRDLTGNAWGPRLVPVIENFEQIATVLGAQGLLRSFVQNQQVIALQLT